MTGPACASDGDEGRRKHGCQVGNEGVVIAPVLVRGRHVRRPGSLISLQAVTQAVGLSPVAVGAADEKSESVAQCLVEAENVRIEWLMIEVGSIQPVRLSPGDVGQIGVEQEVRNFGGN